jgi:hypothetical protein
LKSSRLGQKFRSSLDSTEFAIHREDDRHAEATMTTRKPKPTFSPLIEWPTEQLQWVPVTVEHKAPAPAGKIKRAGGAAIDGAQPFEEPLARHVAVNGASRRRMN